MFAMKDPFVNTTAGSAYELARLKLLLFMSYSRPSQSSSFLSH
jgi:hypothetical protein